MKEMLFGLIAKEVSEGFVNKVNGRRNWVLHVIDNYTGDNRMVVFHGTFGEADKRGCLVNSLADISRRHIRNYFFTYKKDYEKALQWMKMCNYEIW